jgi:single-strand DNA-binding protein
MLIGRPGAEPEVKNISNNNKVARFRLAVDERHMNANREWVNNTQWFTIVAWGKTADRVERNVKKGLQIAIEGSLRNNEWTDDKGLRHTTTEVWVNDLFMIDKVNE